MTKFVRNYDVKGISFTDLQDGRYVVHFLAFLSQKDSDEMFEKYKNSIRGFILYEYDLAVERAKKIGGRKYRAKWYGGGIVFHADYCDLKALADKIISTRG